MRFRNFFLGMLNFIIFKGLNIIYFLYLEIKHNIYL